MNKTIHLPCFQITVQQGPDGKGGTVTSALHDGTDPACSAIESFVLALAGAGFDITTPAMLQAIEETVDAVGNHDDPSYEVVCWCPGVGGNECVVAIQRTEEAALQEAATWIMRELTSDSGGRWADENKKNVNQLAKDEDWEAIVEYYNEHNTGNDVVLIKTCVKVNDGEPDPEAARQKMMDDVEDDN